jgi:hypothetical protein
MAWVIAVQFDEDKTNVGTITATFTDVDATVFSFSQRAAASSVNAFTAAAIAARNTWQTKKTQNASAVSTVKAAFVTAGELAP